MVRGQKVMLDRDLARLYGVPTGALNQAVKRHAGRFPDDFMFRLTPAETRRCREALSSRDPDAKMAVRMPPRVFTEQGVAMLSSVLNSERAVEVNIAIMGAFVRLREVLATHKELADRLESVERRMARRDKRLGGEMRAIWDAITGLMEPPEAEVKRIGFITDRNP